MTLQEYYRMQLNGKTDEHAAIVEEKARAGKNLTSEELTQFEEFYFPLRWLDNVNVNEEILAEAYDDIDADCFHNILQSYVNFADGYKSIIGELCIPGLTPLVDDIYIDTVWSLTVIRHYICDAMLHILKYLPSDYSTTNDDKANLDVCDRIVTQNEWLATVAILYMSFRIALKKLFEKMTYNYDQKPSRPVHIKERPDLQGTVREILSQESLTLSDVYWIDCHAPELEYLSGFRSNAGKVLTDKMKQDFTRRYCSLIWEDLFDMDDNLLNTAYRNVDTRTNDGFRRSLTNFQYCVNTCNHKNFPVSLLLVDFNRYNLDSYKSLTYIRQIACEIILRIWNFLPAEFSITNNYKDNFDLVRKISDMRLRAIVYHFVELRAYFHDITRSMVDSYADEFFKCSGGTKTMTFTRRSGSTFADKAKGLAGKAGRKFIDRLNDKAEDLGGEIGTQFADYINGVDRDKTITERGLDLLEEFLLPGD